MLLVCVFTFTGIPHIEEAYALAPWARTQDATVRRDMVRMAIEKRFPFVFAESKEDRRLLDLNNADILIRPGAEKGLQYLLSEKAAYDDLTFLRAFNRAEVKAIMEIIAGEDANRYAGIKELILSQKSLLRAYSDLFPENRKPNLSVNLPLDDIISRAFELLLLKNQRLMTDSEMTPEEERFLKVAELIIRKNKDTYFTGEFRFSRIREMKIRIALANGQRFDRSPIGAPGDNISDRQKILRLDESCAVFAHECASPFMIAIEPLYEAHLKHKSPQLNALELLYERIVNVNPKPVIKDIVETFPKQEEWKSAKYEHVLLGVLGIISAYLEKLEKVTFADIEFKNENEKRQAETIEKYIEFLKSSCRRFIKARGNFDFIGIREDTDIKGPLERLELYFSTKINIAANVPDGLPRVRIDRDLLLEALLNLVRNARDALAKNIRISAQSEEDFIEIAVKDDGKGMKKKDLPRIFEEYWTKGKKSGTGIGLYVCREILRNAGGTIDVESELGKGTTFIIRLPLAESARQKETHPTEERLDESYVRNAAELLGMEGTALDTEAARGAWILSAIYPHLPILEKNAKVFELGGGRYSIVRGYLKTAIPTDSIWNIDFQGDKGLSSFTIRDDYRGFLSQFADLPDDKKVDLIFTLGGVPSIYGEGPGYSYWEPILNSLAPGGIAVMRPFDQRQAFDSKPGALSEFAQFVKQFDVTLEKVCVIPYPGMRDRRIFVLRKNQNAKVSDPTPPDMNGPGQLGAYQAEPIDDQPSQIATGRAKLAVEPPVLVERNKVLEDIARSAGAKIDTYTAKLTERFKDAPLEVQQAILELFRIADEETEIVGISEQRGISHLKALLVGAKPAWLDFTDGYKVIGEFTENHAEILEFLGLDYLNLQLPQVSGMLLYDIERVKEILGNSNIKDYVRNEFGYDIPTLGEDKEVLKETIERILSKNPDLVGLILGIPVEDVKTFINYASEKPGERAKRIDISVYAKDSASPVKIDRFASIQNLATGLFVDVVAESGEKLTFLKDKTELPTGIEVSEDGTISLIGLRYNPVEQSYEYGVEIGRSPPTEHDFSGATIYDHAEAGLKAYIPVQVGINKFADVYGELLAQKTPPTLEEIEVVKTLSRDFKQRVELVRSEGELYVRKTTSPPALFLLKRLINWYAAREIKVAEALKGAEGLPPFEKRLTPNSFIYKYIPGTTLQDASEIPDDFFDELNRIIEGLHEKGFSLFIGSVKDVVVSEAGKPFLIDFETVVAKPKRRGVSRIFGNLLFEIGKKEDLCRIAQWKVRYKPDLATSEDRRLARQRRPVSTACILLFHNAFANALKGLAKSSKGEKVAGRSKEKPQGQTAAGPSTQSPADLVSQPTDTTPTDMNGPGQLGAYQAEPIAGQPLLDEVGDHSSEGEGEEVPVDITPPSSGSLGPVDIELKKIWHELEVTHEIDTAEAARQIMEEVLPAWAYSEENVINSETAKDILKKALRITPHALRVTDEKENIVLETVFMREAVEILTRYESAETTKQVREELKSLSHRMFPTVAFFANYNCHMKVKEMAEAEAALRAFEENALEELKSQAEKTDVDEIMLGDLNHEAWNSYHMQILPALSGKTVLIGQMQSRGKEVLVCARDAYARVETLLSDLPEKTGLPRRMLYDICSLVSELCYNAYHYGTGGVVTIRKIYEGENLIGVEIVARDFGPGMKDVQEAMSKPHDDNGGNGFKTMRDSIFAKDGEIVYETNDGTACRVFAFNRNSGEFKVREGAEGKITNGTRARFTWVRGNAAAETSLTPPATGDEGEIDEFSRFNSSIMALREIAEQDFVDQADMLNQEAGYYGKSGQSLILYADDILENAVMLDLEDTIKNILVKHKILQGGKIVLFARKAASATILERMVKRADPNINVITITKDELRNTNGSELNEIKSLVNFAKRKGAKEILAIIRGPIEHGVKQEKLNAIVEYCRSKEIQVPIVIVGAYGKALYSFAQAVTEAIIAKTTDGNKRWLIPLRPIEPLSKELHEQYEQYLVSLQALQAA